MILLSKSKEKWYNIKIFNNKINYVFTIVIAFIKRFIDLYLTSFSSIRIKVIKNYNIFNINYSIIVIMFPKSIQFS
ncbi:hypothetical protein BFU36_05345 [Sulfolobus sp. A20]|nr:hypothetical protein BFU36_05345 [Sulfolobus sp. A20]TRM79095.1 hypothetical protein DJ528_02700 [Sulfolobus sp. B5]TRM99030.1 hypothetical protein DJ530_09570 [Sulfolobus sp. E1]TRN03130.1 hypothetical protein DJ527_02475 [Sulfolobus sp. F1]